MRKLIFILLLTAPLAARLRAQVAPVDENGLALGGYDVVSYFDNGPKVGSSKYKVQYNNATYQFVSANNRNAFKKNPEQYLPQFDGYCAWGVAAKADRFPIDPETYDIVDGKLYLFYNGPYNGANFDSSQLWHKERNKLRAEAHEKWPEMETK